MLDILNGIQMVLVRYCISRHSELRFGIFWKLYTPMAVGRPVQELIIRGSGRDFTNFI